MTTPTLPPEVARPGIYTTMNRIRERGMHSRGLEKLLCHLGKTQADDEPLSYVTILDSNGLDDALWCCRAEPQHSRVWRLFAVHCAESVKHLMTDQRSLAAIEVARRHADGMATDDELAAAGADARMAVDAGDAAWVAVSAAWVDSSAAWAASWAASWAALCGAAWDELKAVFRGMVSTHGEQQ